MIGIAKSCIDIRGLCHYVLDDSRGYEIDRNLSLICGSTPHEIFEEFSILQSLNARATKKTISIIISPHPDDGRRLSDMDMKEISRSFMERLGAEIERTQYITFLHNDRDHLHLHVIMSRVKLDSTIISDNFIKLKGMAIAHEIALERGLVSARSKMLESRSLNPVMLDQDWRIKREIFRESKFIVQNKETSMENYAAHMKKKGMIVNFTENKRGEVQGYTIFHEKTQRNFKSSEVHSDLSMQRLFECGMRPGADWKLTPKLNKAFSFQLGKQLLKEVSKINRQIEKEYDR